MYIPNSLLRLWAARLASKLAVYSAFGYDLYHLQKARSQEGTVKLAVADDRRRWRDNVRKERREEQRSVEDIFIRGLITAGRCGHCAPRVRRVKGWSTARSSTRQDGRSTVRATCPSSRHFSTITRKQRTATVALPEPAEVTREEAIALVNTYNSPADLAHQERIEQYPLAPRLVIPPKSEDRPPYTPRRILAPEDADHAANLALFHRTLARDPGRVSLTKLWNTFLSLQQPRLRYVADDDIRKAFRHLAWVEFKAQPHAMPRYFSLLEECLSEGIALETTEWNTAISFAGRMVVNATSAEVKRAVETWLRMEKHGGKADSVTFNILFDVAIKSGRFALADTIFAELKQQGLQLSRHFRLSNIYYAGLKGDGDAVRQAFRDYVNAGEFVDTIIMNTVILSLVRAGEPAAAENVFLRMKRLFEQKLGADALRNWRDNKELRNLLRDTARRLRDERKEHERSFFGAAFASEGRKEKVQRLTPIAPDAGTYKIFIQHHSYASGDFERIRALLEEMKGRGFRIHGSIYVHILKGFWIHGGYAYTAWNRRALEELWAEFLIATATASSPAAEPTGSLLTPEIGQGKSSSDHDDLAPEQAEEDRAPYFTKSLVLSAIRAFYKCAGKKRMLKVWTEIRDQWPDRSEDAEHVVRKLIQRFVAEDSVYIIE